LNAPLDEAWWQALKCQYYMSSSVKKILSFNSWHFYPVMNENANLKGIPQATKYRNGVIPAKAGIHKRLDTGSSPV
jgi:hypothetical protein